MSKRGCFGVLVSIISGLGLQIACSNDEAADTQLGLTCTRQAADEQEPAFAGYSASEVNLAFSSIAHRVDDFCLIYHFQGRSSCPYGQTETEIATLPATDPARCRVTTGDLSMTDQPVDVAVLPQLVDRPPEKTIYNSCACSGTDASQKYCDCPSGMHCESQPEHPQTKITGVCVRDDSVYDTAARAGLECSKTDSDPSTDCGNNRQNP